MTPASLGSGGLQLELPTALAHKQVNEKDILKKKSIAKQLTSHWWCTHTRSWAGLGAIPILRPWTVSLLCMICMTCTSDLERLISGGGKLCSVNFSIFIKKTS